MMDKSAITQIQTLGSAPVLLEQLAKTGFPVAALPENFHLHSLEPFMPQRNQFRGTMKTSHIEEFVNYSIKYEIDGSQCFINPDVMTAEAIFDLGTQSMPGHCNHKAHLKLKPTADFQELKEINDERLSQKVLAEWIEDFSDNLQAFERDGTVIDIAVASAAIRNMTFEHKRGGESSVDDFSASQSEYESMAIRTKEEYPMPAVFKFTCAPYHGLSERSFELRMSTIGNQTLVLRIKKLEAHVEAMGEEFKGIIIDKLTSEDAKHIKTFIGQFAS
ncbi:DUF2303 family protein [Salinivibrio sp. YCSC6]|uniref:DUF2303 family protein n=1 Tax=Salinivibrio sp. YCSC6 TaxID=2003370 RepID=UPI001F0A54CE|nr:DUF2303 family protein [Salinivibrio sp. YCSC6]